jgi:hypothetical protein
MVATDPQLTLQTTIGFARMTEELAKPSLLGEE